MQYKSSLIYPAAHFTTKTDWQLTGWHDELGLRVSCITNLGVPEDEEQYIIIMNEMNESE